DTVIANAQDSSGFNNANFMRPPDGQNGRCRMYLWNTVSPYPDGDMEAGIVIHKLAHGLLPRLTGRPKNSGCLGRGECGGMGEGWGGVLFSIHLFLVTTCLSFTDFIVTSVHSASAYSDYAMGAWASHRKGGIHHYIYSLDTTVNPSTYKTLNKPGYWGVHAIGEVWAETLWVVQQRLIGTYGFSETILSPTPNADGSLPPNDFYRLQTFNPLTALFARILRCRDVIVQADKILTRGENTCALWEGFAERGLGVDATVIGSTSWGGGVRQDVSRHPFLSC
ncbi:hypothetical protein BDN67DRAFT_916229, partial [Paxillus ammoniavirescens]